ncbi:hypothetical protein Tco_0073641 [Tanacetum coccineum]
MLRGLDQRAEKDGEWFKFGLDQGITKSMAENEEGYSSFAELLVVEGLTLERSSTFGKKDKLELSYVGAFEILGWIGPKFGRGPELTWERKDQMRSKCPQLFVSSANASSS